MTMVVADEAAKVRRACGSPGTTQLPEADLLAMFEEDALDWINDRRPGELIGSLATVADKQDYALDTLSATLPASWGTMGRIKKVWWLEASWMTFSSDLRVVPNALDIDDQMAGFSVVDNPSLVLAFYKKITSYNEFFRGDWDVVDDGTMQYIRLIPAPSSGGDTVFVHFTFNRSSILYTQDIYTPAIRHYVTHLALDYLATKRTVVVSGRNWSGGGGKIERDRSAEFLEKAEAIVPNPPLVSMG